MACSYSVPIFRHHYYRSITGIYLPGPYVPTIFLGPVLGFPFYPLYKCIQAAGKSHCGLSGERT